MHRPSRRLGSIQRASRNYDATLAGACGIVNKQNPQKTSQRKSETIATGYLPRFHFYYIGMTAVGLMLARDSQRRTRLLPQQYGAAVIIACDCPVDEAST